MTFMALSKGLIFLALTAFTRASFDNNLVYRSPLKEIPSLGIDTNEVTKRIVKRQTNTTPNKFADDHYPTFYGADFSNAPTIWSGGLNFTHSVASGDPFDTSVLLWTRAVPTIIPTTSAPSSPPAGSDTESVPVCVSFEIFPAPASAMTSRTGTFDFPSGRPVASGTAFTSFDVDFTVKVEATGLEPDSHYVFRFADCTNPSSFSDAGRTRTIASPNTPASQVNGGKGMTLAVFSCSNFPNGYFNAYHVAIQNTSADIFVHLGDYIYESLGNGGPIGRAVLGRELATIHDYRQRLGQYRTDIGARQAHQNAPWITVWDDHEVADQSWKAGTADSNDTTIGCTFSPSGACFTDRKLAAVRAYHEWLPVRQVTADDKLRIWRNFQIGKLLDLSMLDTRQYDRDITDVYYNTDFIESISDFQNRSLMGFEQENWFLSTLSQSKQRDAVWRIVGQQIVFIQLNKSGTFDVDAWDGYKANRARILTHLKDNKIDNTIILSGDSHANWVSDLAFPNDTTTYNPTTGHGALGVELGGTAVSSGSSFGSNLTPATADTKSQIYVAANADLQWSEGFYRGFFTLQLTAKLATATFFAMQNISSANLDHFNSATFLINAGANMLSRPVAGGNVSAGALKSQVH